MMMDNALSTGLTMYVSEDDSPADQGRYRDQPQGRAVVAFDQTVYLSETAPGRVSFIGLLLAKASEICPNSSHSTKVGDSLLHVGSITAG